MFALHAASSTVSGVSVPLSLDMLQGTCAWMFIAILASLSPFSSFQKGLVLWLLSPISACFM